ncbi:MAG: 50S ribosomal protein L29 [Acidimicrobiia bacterium]|nr:50S ribosomal protein L29 [Acidimicrobiia bacterium]MDH4366431.1 50S ribosomal protein L29 [Acidimicrobiia bacterium]MDH5290337.1 50S ribosomal protein L29 [Acidimicrobiia bacterium]
MPKPPNLTEESNSDLVTGLAEAKRELFNLRFQHATGQLENSARVGQVRKQIARYRTEIRNREIAAAEALASKQGES